MKVIGFQIFSLSRMIDQVIPVKPQPVRRYTVSHRFTDSVIHLRRIWKLIGRPWF